MPGEGGPGRFPSRRESRGDQGDGIMGILGVGLVMAVCGCCQIIGLSLSFGKHISPERTQGARRIQGLCVTLRGLRLKDSGDLLEDKLSASNQGKEAHLLRTLIL